MFQDKFQIQMIVVEAVFISQFGQSFTGKSTIGLSLNIVWYGTEITVTTELGHRVHDHLLTGTGGSGSLTGTGGSGSYMKKKATGIHPCFHSRGPARMLGIRLEWLQKMNLK